MIISKEQLSVLQGFKLHTWNVFHNKTPNMFKFWAKELDDKKIPYFEAFKILNREYSASLEAEKEMKKDADNYELEKRELVKEKILKKDN